MWSDTLLIAEQHHVRYLLVWGAASAVLGGALLWKLRAGRGAVPLLWSFAIQTAVWGGLEFVFECGHWFTLHLRDLESATILARLTWLGVGMESGAVVLGLTISAIAWRTSRRLGGVGAGLAIALQGAALVVFDLRLLAVVSR